MVNKMKKNIKIPLIIIFIILVGLGSYFITKILVQNYITKNNTIENISLKVFTDRFNKNLENENVDTKLNIEESIADNNKTYWINVEKDIDIAIMMDKVTEDKNKDIVRISGISYKNIYEDTDKIKKYLEILIKSNNPKLNKKEIDKMIENANNTKDAVTKDKNTTTANFDYKGLSIDKNIGEESTIYRIARYN